MNEVEYLRQRVDDQISWYSKKSRSNQKYFKIISFIEICLSTSLVLLAVFLNDSIMKYGSAIIGTTLSILSGIMGLNKFQENWIQYRTTAEWLKNFEGTIVCDDYAGYNQLKKGNPKIKLQKCMAHARRRFADILKSLKEDERKGTKSYEILSLFGKIFEYESQYKKDNLTPIRLLREESKIKSLLKMNYIS